MQRLIDQLAAVTESIVQQLHPLARLLAEATKPGGELHSFVKGMALYAAISNVSEDSGWLPHQTVPFEQMLRDCRADRRRFSEMVSDYYENHGNVVLDSIVRRLAEYSIDDEARATMVEAVDAYNSGLHRCVCRVLLPEIERIVREELLGVARVSTLRESEFHDFLNKHHLEDFILTGPSDLVLFGRLSKHVFRYVKSRHQVEQESTPNRHAATHGWLSYSSNKNSLNTIICADYVYRLVTVLGKTRGHAMC